MAGCKGRVTPLAKKETKPMNYHLNTGQLVTRYFGSKAEAETALDTFLRESPDHRGTVWLFRCSPELWTARITRRCEDGDYEFVGNLQPA